MRAPLLALSALALLSGCMWEGRPDGAEAVRTAGDGYYDVDAEPQVSPLGGVVTETEAIEPAEGVGAFDAQDLGGTDAAPVPLDQPAPTTGTADNTSEVEEALTPGTEQ